MSRGLLAGVLLVGALPVVAGCGTADPATAGAGAAGGTTPRSTTASWTPDYDGGFVSSPPPTTGDVVPPAPLVTSTTRPEGGTPCTAGMVTFEVTGWDAAMGARFAGLVVRNTGAKPCLLDGYPTLRLYQGGGDLEIRTVRGRSRLDPPSTTYPPQPPYLLAPGARAASVLEWHAGASRPDYTSEQELSVELGPDERTSWATAAFAGDLPGDQVAPFDVNSYDVISVTAWKPEVGGAS